VTGGGVFVGVFVGVHVATEKAPGAKPAGSNESAWHRRPGADLPLLAYYANPIAQLFALPALNRLAGAYAPASKVTRYTRAGLPDCRPPLWVNR
jgi:hypothetical protein